MNNHGSLEYPIVQSERLTRYTKVALDLIKSKKAYFCKCKPSYAHFIPGYYHSPSFIDTRNENCFCSSEDYTFADSLNHNMAIKFRVFLVFNFKISYKKIALGLMTCFLAT